MVGEQKLQGSEGNVITLENLSRVGFQEYSIGVYENGKFSFSYMFSTTECRGGPATSLLHFQRIAREQGHNLTYVISKDFEKYDIRECLSGLGIKGLEGDMLDLATVYILDKHFTGLDYDESLVPH